MMLDSPDLAKLEAALAARNSKAAFALFERQRQMCEQLREELENVRRERDEKLSGIPAVTQRYEEELQKREREFRTLAENTLDGIIRFDRDFRITFVNEVAARMMQSSPEELLGKSPGELPMPLHLASLWHGGVERALHNRVKESFEYEFDDLRMVHYLRINMIPEFGPDGKVESVLAITRDVSEQKMTAIELRESEERLWLALGTSPITIFAQDSDLRYTWMYSSNPSWLGEMCIGHTDEDIFPAGEADRLASLKQMVLATGQPAHDEFEATIAEGKVWFDTTVAPLRNNEREIVGIIGATLDITKHKQVEKALRESRDYLQSITDNTPAAIYIKDMDGKIVVANQALGELLGRPAKEIVGKTSYDFYPREMAEEHMANDREVMDRGEPVSFEETVPDDGRKRTFLSVKFPLKDEAGCSNGIGGISLEITGMKNAEAILRESEKRQAFLLELSDALTPLANPAEIRDEAFRLLGKHLGADRVYYSEIDPDDESMVILHDYYTSGKAPNISGRYRIEDFSPYVYRENLANRTVIAADKEELPEDARAGSARCGAHGVRAFISCPLVKAGRLVAVFGVAQLTPREWTKTDAALVGETAERTWESIQRARAEVALRESESKLRALFSAMNDLILVLDSDGRYLEIVPTNPDRLYKPASELLGKTLSEVFPADKADFFLRHIQEALGKQKPVTMEYSLTIGDADFWFSATLSPLSGKSVIYVARDITDRKRWEESLRESEEQHRLLFENMRDAFFLAEPVYDDAGNAADWRFLDANAAYASMAGLPLEKVVGRLNSELFPGAEPVWSEIIARVARTGVPENLESFFEHTGRWYTVRYYSPRPGITAAITSDITERMRTDEALRESEQRLRVLFESDMMGMICWNMDGQITDANEKFLQMVGCSREWLTASRLSWTQMTPPEHRPLDEYALNELRTTGVDTPYEKEYIRLDGSRIPIIIGAAMLDEKRYDGVAFVLDISERKLAEQALRESEDRYRTISQLTTDFAFSFRVSPEGGVDLDWIAGAIETISGYTIQEMPTLEQWAAIIHPEDWIQVREQARLQLSRGGDLRMDVRFTTKGGELRWLHYITNAILDETGNVVRINGAAQDITERHRLEENISRLRREQEAFLRHEMKNLFAPIQLFAELILDSPNLTDEQSHYLQRIVETSKRAARFIDSLKRLQDIENGKYRLNRVRQTLDALIRKTVQSLEPIARKNGVVLQFRDAGEGAAMGFDPNLMPGVFHNLILNAVQHVARLRNPASKVVTVDLTRETGRSVVRINNKGEPVPPERLAIFFDKFNVGPEKKGGTGLGTTYAYLVTKAHGGDITVSSNAAEGTTVTLTFPAK